MRRITPHRQEVGVSSIKCKNFSNIDHANVWTSAGFARSVAIRSHSGRKRASILQFQALFAWPKSTLLGQPVKSF